MICPTCGHDNLPGSEECSRCLQDLTQLDRPTAHDRIERSLMEDPVSVLQPAQTDHARPTTTVRDAMRIMLARDIGALLVVDDDGKLLGIFSERDLLTKVAGDTRLITPTDRSGLHDAQAPRRLPRPTRWPFALHKMDVGGYRHLPVLEEGRPVGVISVRDMLRHITRLCRQG